MAELNDTPATRVAFVGQRIYFEQCSLTSPAGGLEPTFIDFRQGANTGPLVSALRAFDPDVLVVFRPEIIPAGLFRDLRATTLGYLTEPLPRGTATTHQDLVDRLGWLQEVDPGNFDRIVSFDPLITQTASGLLPVWRSVPIPVADEMFMDVRPRATPPHLLFVGRSTPYRETMLAPLKARHPIIHVGHGLFGPPLLRFLRTSDVQLNLHNNPYPTFENRVCIALAAGHLVISEPLSPTHDLQDGRELLISATADGMGALVDELADDPHAHLDIQHAGRRAAERFRASTVYPALIADALDDVAASGRGRPRVAV